MEEENEAEMVAKLKHKSCRSASSRAARLFTIYSEIIWNETSLSGL